MNKKRQEIPSEKLEITVNPQTILGLMVLGFLICSFLYKNYFISYHVHTSFPSVTKFSCVEDKVSEGNFGG